MSSRDSEAFADLARQIADLTARAVRAEQTRDRIASLAATFRENPGMEWSGTEIAQMIHANLEGER